MATNRKTLSRFTVQRRGDRFSLHIEDDAGDVIEFEATPDQIEVIADALEDMLEEDDADDEVHA
ncbi:MAG: hypothetical protein JWO83_2877 [Caulobacteraceae bacterium]|nr:hypothetical protein [Caulobacteraceae bacterium]